MKATILLIIPVCMLLIMSSCSEALHRNIPQSKHRSSGRELPELNERKTTAEVSPSDEAIAVESGTVRDEAVPVKEEAALHPEKVENPAVVATCETAARKQYVIADPEDDSLEVSAEEVDEALESERVARQAYQFSFMPIFTLIFFPMLFVGLIGTLSKLARFRKYEYVTEAGLDYERRAKRTLLASIFVPLLAVLLFILVLILLI